MLPIPLPPESSPVGRSLPVALRLLRWGLLPLGLGAAWLAFNYDTLKQYFEARDRRNENRRLVHQLERQRQTLAEEKAALLRGGFAAEKAVREGFKMARPQERVILVEPPPAEASAPPAALPGP